MGLQAHLAFGGIAPRARQPQGFASEAYLNGTSQGVKPEDAWKDGQICGCSRRFMKHPGWGEPFPPWNMSQSVLILWVWGANPL